MAGYSGYSNFISTTILKDTSIDMTGYMHHQIGQHPKYDAAVAYFKRLILDELYSFGINAWIGGGAVRDYFLYNKITSDIDLYFPNQEHYDAAKEWIINNAIPFSNSPASEYYQIEKEKGIVVRANLKNSLKIKYKNIDLDLVKMFRSNEIETIKSFDMTICAAAVSNEGVFMANDFLLDLASKQIHFQSLHNPFSTLVRLQKYIKKGFSVSYNELHKLAYEIKTIPIAEINPVEFQLDQLEQQYGVPRESPDHIGMHGSQGFSRNPVDEIIMPHFVSPGVRFREIDQAVVQQPLPPQPNESILDRILSSFSSDKKEEYENDGY